MAELKPVGIDQTTGQSRPVASNDNLVNDVGDIIELAVTQVYDYSGNLRNNVQVLFPWSNPQKLTNPASAPTQNTIMVKWSPDGEYLATTHDSPSKLNIYSRVGTTFTRLTNPSSMPTGDVFDITWSLDGQFLATAGNGVLNVYQRSGNTFTRLTDPSTVASGCYGVDFSPNGEFLAVTSFTPAVYVYRRDGTTLTKLTDPQSLPANGQNAKVRFSPNGEFLALNGSDGFSGVLNIYQKTDLSTFTLLPDPTTFPSSNGRLEWSPDGKYLVSTSQGGNDIFIYKRSGNSFTKLDNPSSVTTGGTYGCSWSPNSKYLAIAYYTNSPYISVYQRDNDTFTRLPNPSTLPTGQGLGINWSNDGQFLAVGHVASPYLTIYQTDSDMPTSGILTTIGLTLT